MSIQSRVEKSARRAATALSSAQATPSEEVVASIYDTATMDLDVVTMPYGPLENASVPSAQHHEIGAALLNEEIALAVLPEDRLIFFRPDAIAALLQQDPDVRDHTEWESLVWLLVVYGFRVASVTTRGGKFRLDIHHMYRR